MKILPTILSINPHRESIIKDHEHKLVQTKAVIGLPIEHDSARMHVQGGAQYIDDIPEPNGTLHVAFALSNVAHGKIKSVYVNACLLYTSPSPRDLSTSRMPSSA